MRAASEISALPRTVHRSEGDDGGEGRVQPSPPVDHRSELLGPHLRKHGPLCQRHETDGQGPGFGRSVAADPPPEGVFELLNVKRRMVHNPDEVRLKTTRDAAGVDIVVVRRVLVTQNAVHVVRREFVFSPPDVADLVLTAKRAGIGGAVRFGDRYFVGFNMSYFLAISL